MKLSEVSVKRPVAIIMLMLAVLLLGAVSLQKLNMDLLPEMNLPMALAMTEYQGAGPEEIENLVTRPLEGVIGTVNGVKNINSTSSQGQSIVFVEFAWGTDMNFAVNQMRAKIDMIVNALPHGSKKPMLFKLDPNMMPVMAIEVGGNVDLATLDTLAEEVIQPNLERVNGVASVSVEGGVKREIRISVVPQRLQAYGLTLDKIVNYLRLENRNTSAGTVEEGLKEHTVRVVGEFKSIQEIENLQIALPTGGFIRLADLAQIEDTFKEKKQIVYMNGQPSIQMSIMKQTDANTVKVSDDVLKALEDLKKLLPPGVEIKIGFDQAQYIRTSVTNVADSAYEGAILSIFILLMFLRNIRSTLIISTSIPIAVISTFILMYFSGLTLNVISLGGLALGIGNMVDNAIVILENIHRYRSEGYSRIESAIKGCNEVGLAVTASTFASVVVFLPIVFVQGMAAQIFRPMALTVAFAQVSSLLVALTLVPMLSAKILKVDRGESPVKGRWHFISNLSEKWGRAIESLDLRYKNVLHWSINNKKKVVFSSLALLVVSLMLIPAVGMEFIPAQDSGDYVINISLPQGTALSETQRVTKMVDDIVRELPEHEWTFYAVGAGGMFGQSSGTDIATLQGKLKSLDQRKRNINQVLDEIRTKCADIPGAKIEVQTQGGMGGGFNTTPISIGITGDNLEVLGALSDTIKKRVEQVEGTREIKSSLDEGKPELHVKLNREKADLYGLNFAYVSNILATAVNGTTASQYRTKGEEIDISVILDKEYRQDVNDLEALIIQSPTGVIIILGDVTHLEVNEGPTQINRVNQSRRVTISGDISGRDLRSVTVDIQKTLADVAIPEGVQIEYGGANKEMMDSFADLGLALILAIILVYMIMAAQYESLLYPFVIMFSVPPMFIGVIFSLLITGRTLNVASFIGIIMLAGIVVNNAIVLVDYINTLRERDGLSRKEAILKAGPTRLRPILMTTLTTILGLFPLVLGLGDGAELSAPLATVVFGGLAYSTVNTLVLIPCMYIILEDISDRIKNKFGGLNKKIGRLLTGAEAQTPELTTKEGV